MPYHPKEIIGYIKREKKLPPLDVMLANIGIRRNRPGLPHKIQIEHTTSCNFKCITCSRTTWAKTDPKRLNKNMNLDEFKALVAKIPTLDEVQMQGMGETFLNPNLPEILEYCKSKKIAVTSTTNGSMLEKNLGLIGHFKAITYSLDSANAKNFAEIRVGGSLEKTVDCIRRIVDERNKNNYKTIISINSVITHLNYTEIPEIAEIAHSLGVDVLNFTEVELWTTPGEKDFEREKAFVDKSRVKSGEIKTLVDAEVERYGQYFPKFRIQHNTPEPIKPVCTWPFTSAFITSEGYVTPCCIRPDPTVINFGNIHEKSFEEIWNSERYVEFRKNMAEGRSNPICDRCPN